MTAGEREWPAYRARLIAIDALAAARALEPASFDAAYLAGCFLRDHGRLTDALVAFEQAVRLDPPDARAHHALGALLGQLGRRFDARAMCRATLAAFPGDPAAAVNLANALALDEPGRSRQLYRAVLRAHPDNPGAHQGLCSLAAAEGDAAGAAAHRRSGYGGRCVVRRPYYGRGMPIVALALHSTDGGNVALDALLDPHVVLTNVLYVEAFGDEEPLPPHDVVVVAIGDADRGHAALSGAERIIARTRAPLINAPAALRATTRDAVASRFAGLAGVVAPRTIRAGRAVLCAADGAGVLDAVELSAPLIVRSPGHHMGRHCVRVESLASLPDAAARLPGDELLVSTFHDVRSTDGFVRKYRVMCIDGALYPLHLAVSPDWKVHYFSGVTATDPRLRAEEARFLDDMPAALGARGVAALERIAAALALEYAGIDFALDRDGRIVVFEANAAMAVLPPDPDPALAYRRPAYDRVLAALRALVRSRVPAPLMTR